MDFPYIRVVVLLHAAFAGVFFFLNRQHPSKFARLLAVSWVIEGLRAAILLPNVNGLGGVPQAWYDLSAVLCLAANWCLLAACADLAGVRLPAWLAPVYFCVSLPVRAFDRFVLPGVLNASLEGEAFAAALGRLQPAPRIVIMSGLSRGGSGSSPPAEMGDAFLQKPFKPFALLAAIHRLLQAGPPDLS